MNISLHDEMILAYKTLILYILKDIDIIELKRIIWEKIFEEEEEELINQLWYEIDEIPEFNLWYEIDEIPEFNLWY